MDTRKEHIEALKEMQGLQSKIKRIDKSLAQLSKDESKVDIEARDYKTDHADRLRDKRDYNKFQIVEKYNEKKKQETAKFKFIPWIGVAVGIALAVFVQIFLGIIVLIAGFVVKKVLASSVNKNINKECDAALDVEDKEYESKLDEAERLDEAEQERYERDLAQARKERKAANKEEREKLEAEKKACKQKFESVRIISDSDMPDINRLISILESNRADNIKEALLELDNERRRAEEERRRREEERRRREEEERRRREEEAARLAMMPGKVHVRIGSINTYSGRLQTVANVIYIDGAAYGAGDATGATVFQLNPGPHSVYAQLKEAGYIFTTPTQSFVLPGSGDVYIKVAIRNARATISLCSSMSDMMS